MIFVSGAASVLQTPPLMMSQYNQKSVLKKLSHVVLEAAFKAIHVHESEMHDEKETTFEKLFVHFTELGKYAPV